YSQYQEDLPRRPHCYRENCVGRSDKSRPFATRSAHASWVVVFLLSQGVSVVYHLYCTPIPNTRDGGVTKADVGFIHPRPPPEGHRAAYFRPRRASSCCVSESEAAGSFEVVGTDDDGCRAGLGRGRCEIDLGGTGIDVHPAGILVAAGVVHVHL